MEMTGLRESALELRRRSRPSTTWSEAETVLALAIAIYGDPARLGGTKRRKDGSTRQDPAVQLVAHAIGRTEDAVVLKVMNLRTVLTQGGRGMPHGGRGDSAAVARYAPHLESLLAAVVVVTEQVSSAAGLLEELTVVPSDDSHASEPWLQGDRTSEPVVTERLASQVQRIGQPLFRSRVMRNFGHACGFCGLRSQHPARNSFLLVASHVLPWRTATSHQRLDPRNGLALCAIHDRAFDWGFMTVDESLRVVVSEAAARHYAPRERVEAELLRLANAPLGPHVQARAEEYLAHHRTQVFDRRFRGGETYGRS